MDDWNRKDERWTILCKECKNTHVVYMIQVWDKGTTYDSFKIVPREIVGQLEEAKNKLGQIDRQIKEIIQKKHEQKCLERIEKLSTKKIWELLAPYRSLSAFYSDVKVLGLANEIKSYLNYENVKKLLGTADDEIEALVRQQGALEERISEIKKKI